MTEYHEDATCMWCHQALEVERDAVCTQCVPDKKGWWWPLAEERRIMTLAKARTLDKGGYIDREAAKALVMDAKMEEIVALWKNQRVAEDRLTVRRLVFHSRLYERHMMRSTALAREHAEIAIELARILREEYHCPLAQMEIDHPWLFPKKKEEVDADE